MKRLRENAMLEAQISVDGDVYVEGHLVGQLAGFRFTPDREAEGSDAKAVLGAAQKALGIEFEARAARLHAAGNGDFAIGSDGTLRWLGEPVGRLAAGEEPLRPRVILFADDQLQGAAREHVVARLERFVQHHIATVLKPLDDLAHADDIEGLARGLAYQLVENFGVLFRRDVADEVKALDQDARAQLRRYGVRFGAYHVFLPALLKPAPAELITLLWALRNDGLDKPGYGELITVLSAGRTSVVTEPSYERTFYKLAGFRFLGKRAVRIDILERLADLIRPALQWKPGSGQRPEGAYDGRRFTTTPAMLSILGATAEDIEEILKGLGYRADEVSAEEAAAHLVSVDPAPASAAEPAGQEADAAAAPQEDVAAEEGKPDPAAAEAASDTTPETESETGETPATPPAGDTGEAAAGPAETTAAVQAEAGADTVQAESASDVDAGEGTDETKAQPEEPKPVLLWRPAGPRNDNRRSARPPRGRKTQEPGQPEHDQRQARGAPKPGRKPDRHGKNGKRSFSARPPQKERPVDPDSPFAKLAALKEKLGK